MLVPNQEDNMHLRYRIEQHKDADGNIDGWKLVETASNGEYNILVFNNDGVLTNYKSYTCNIIHNPNDPHIDMELVFSNSGELVKVVRWDYLPEDCLGRDWYSTVYGADGNEICSDWHGQA